jgi:hypothetical protein
VQLAGAEQGGSGYPVCTAIQTFKLPGSLTFSGTTFPVYSFGENTPTIILGNDQYAYDAGGNHGGC